MRPSLTFTVDEFSSRRRKIGSDPLTPHQKTPKTNMNSIFMESTAETAGQTSFSGSRETKTDSNKEARCNRGDTPQKRSDSPEIAATHRDRYTVPAEAGTAAGALLVRDALAQRRLRRREAGDGHAEGGARHVVQADLVAELHRRRVAHCAPADTELNVRSHGRFRSREGLPQG